MKSSTEGIDAPREECPGRDVLAELALGRLSASVIESIGPHVESCLTCQATLETLDEVADSVVRDLRTDAGLLPVDPALAEHIREAEAISREAWGCAADVAENEDFQPGRQLGQYQLLARIGRGGMGAVFKALHTRLKRHVAIKLLPPERTRDPRAVSRFFREMEAVGRLDHPNLVRAHDAGEAEGQHFLVMELVDGVNLGQIVRRIGSLGIADACEVIRQAALGLQHAHEHGLVHRDIKPSNLMLTAGGQVKVLDLGLARLTSDAEAPSEMTGSGQVMGTSDFMAPEQGQDVRQADVRSDIYSLGCTLYFLLTGRAPFAGPEYDTLIRKIIAHAQQPMPSLRQFRSDVPPGLNAALKQMVAKNPEDRPSSAALVADALATFTARANLPLLVSVAGDDAAERDQNSADLQNPSPPAMGSRSGRKGALMIALALLALVPFGLWLGSNAGAMFCLGGGPEVVDKQPASVGVSSGSGRIVSIPATPASVKRAGGAAATDAGFETATAYLKRAEIPETVREAMLTVLRQHPSDSRWSGRSASTLFAIAVKPLPGVDQRAVPAALSLTHVLAVHELLKAKCLLDRYASAGLDDATTLRQAVVEAAGGLQVIGKARGVTHQSALCGRIVVAYVLADEPTLTAHLLQPVELSKVRAAYRDVMHEQARDLMKRANWKDALLLWRHLHARKLVSPQLYLDAARCFAQLGQETDVVRVISEAIDAVGTQMSAETLEEAGDLAIAIRTPAAQDLAERAYRGASDKLKEWISQPENQRAGGRAEN